MIPPVRNLICPDCDYFRNATSFDNDMYNHYQGKPYQGFPIRLGNDEHLDSSFFVDVWKENCDNCYPDGLACRTFVSFLPSLRMPERADQQLVPIICKRGKSHWHALKTRLQRQSMCRWCADFMNAKGMFLSRRIIEECLSCINSASVNFIDSL